MSDKFPRQPSSYDNSPGIREFAVTRGTPHRVQQVYWEQEKEAQRLADEQGEEYVSEAVKRERFEGSNGMRVG